MSIGSVRSEISPSSLGSIQSDASSSAYALSAASASSSSSPSGSLYLMKSNESDKDGDKRIAKGKGKEKDHNNSTSHRFGSGWGLGSYFPPSSTASTSTLTPSTVPSPLRSEVISETVVCKGHWIELKSVAGENRKGGYKGEQELFVGTTTRWLGYWLDDEGIGSGCDVSCEFRYTFWLNPFGE